MVGGESDEEAFAVSKDIVEVQEAIEEQSPQVIKEEERKEVEDLLMSNKNMSFDNLSSTFFFAKGS